MTAPSSLTKALSAAAKPDAAAFEQLITATKSLEHGDFALPCFTLAKTWGVKPNEAAEKLRSLLSLPKEFEKCEVVGPYLNFFLKRSLFAASTISKTLKEGETVGLKPANNRKILVEYSSPNIVKIFHVGHLRTTLIGLSLERIFKHCGYDVSTINHLGDWGTQFGFVWAGCELWGKPDPVTVDGLVDLYVRASALRKDQAAKTVAPEDASKPDVNEMARDYFKRLEANDAEARAFWQWCLDLSLNYFKDIYKRLGIQFDYYTGESFYSGMLEKVEQTIRDSGILEKSEGSLGVDLGKELGFARIFTEDGRSLYLTRDIATAFYRHQTFKPEKSLYVVASAQSLHFKQLIGILEKMKHPAAKELVHVPFGNVPGMSSRSGGAISLSGYLNEAVERALKAYHQEVQKRPEGVDEKEITEKVAIGATYFYFLSHSNTKDFHFRWEEALNFQGDSGPYLQYALGRLNSIEAKAKENGITVPAKINGELLKEDLAHEISVLLSRFDDVVAEVTRTYEPSILAGYLLELARSVARAYNSLRVVGEDKALAEARLALLIAARNTLKQGLILIGVPPVERM
jgi:arginyl-tRNA synthetase